MIELHSLTGLVVMLVVGAISGLIGALTGIGGGAIVVPTLVLAFDSSFQTAVAASLAAVVANSGMASVTYLRQGLTHLGLAFRLEIFTTVGGIAGGLVSALLPRPVLEGTFALVQFFSAWLTYQKRRVAKTQSALADTAVDARHGAVGDERRPRTNGAQGPPAAVRVLIDRGMRALEHEGATQVSGVVVGEVRQRAEPWVADNWPLGGVASCGAGVMSGLLGIGGGFLKVPAMNIGMHVPLRVATATSQFMLGITAVAGFTVYFARGDVSVLATAPTVVGMALGSSAGARLAASVSESAIRFTYSAVILLSGIAFGLAAAGALAL